MRPALKDAPTGGEQGAVEVDESPPPSKVWLHVLLFALTVLTTTATGALFANRGQSIFPLVNGLSFSLPLMAILTCHELGHYFAARLHGVHASLPFFIPLPPQVGLFGTMGFNPLANVLGFVALAAPAGVGVREAVLISGYGAILGSGGALSAAIVSRVASLIADVGAWALVRLWVLKRRRALPTA